LERNDLDSNFWSPETRELNGAKPISFAILSGEILNFTSDFDCGVVASFARKLFLSLNKVPEIASVGRVGISAPITVRIAIN
jgi:hypothetical protein